MKKLLVALGISSMLMLTPTLAQNADQPAAAAPAADAMSKPAKHKAKVHKTKVHKAKSHMAKPHKAKKPAEPMASPDAPKS